MHEEAILTTSNALLGQIGAPVSIDKVKAHYPSSVQANAGITYKCANPKCGVAVTAVIPDKNKPGRKKSPSPYFAARGKAKHLSGCDRKALQTVTPVQTTPAATQPANPNRLDAPSIWVDPLAPLQHSAATPNATGISNPQAPTQTGGRSTSGQGTSLGQSQMVERFARSWKSMSVSERRGKALQAPWNKGGTYYSAFFPLRFFQGRSVETLGDKIFVGTFKSIVKGKSGYTITLAEKHPDGNELRIWIKNEALAATSSSGLQQALAKIATPTPVGQHEIYAFGTFSKQMSKSGGYTWYAVPVIHPHQVWLDV